jgi:hypothetical protein
MGNQHSSEGGGGGGPLSGLGARLRSDLSLDSKKNASKLKNYKVTKKLGKPLSPSVNLHFLPFPTRNCPILPAQFISLENLLFIIIPLRICSTALIFLFTYISHP